jgi:hypothetical protein
MKIWEGGKDMGVASLVLGILAILITVFTGGSFGWIGAILAILGTILGAVGRKNPEKKGLATAGLVVSIIGLILGLVLYVACVACIGLAAVGLE